MKRIAIALLFAVVALAAAAQQFDLSIDNIMRGPGLYGWTPEDVRWSPDGQHVYFSWKLYSDTLEHDRDTYVVNRDGSGLRKLSDDEKKDAPPANAQWTRDKHRAVYLDDARRLSLGFRDRQAARADADERRRVGAAVHVR